MDCIYHQLYDTCFHHDSLLFSIAYKESLQLEGYKESRGKLDGGGYTELGNFWWRSQYAFDKNRMSREEFPTDNIRRHLPSWEADSFSSLTYSFLSPSFGPYCCTPIWCWWTGNMWIVCFVLTALSYLSHQGNNVKRSCSSDIYSVPKVQK